MKHIRKFCSYFLTGAAATLVEWAVFWLLDQLLHIYYLTATAVAFLVSTFFNWLFGRLWTFKEPAGKPVWKEIVLIYLTAAGGLLLNLILMSLFVEQLGLAPMPAKILTTALVFFYNYLVRILFIYRPKGGNKHA